jgi:hypothetical protein
MKIAELKEQTIDVQLQNGLDYLNSFFDSGLPKEHRKDLKKWRNHVINDKQYNHRHGAGRVFAQYEETVQLIEASDICFRHKNVVIGLSIATNKMIEFERSEWIYFPKNLCQKELLNPTVVIENFFKFLTATDYKGIFHEWLRLALSNRSAGESINVKDIVLPFENLRKLYSAMWLVHKRCS